MFGQAVLNYWAQFGGRAGDHHQDAFAASARHGRGLADKQHPSAQAIEQQGSEAFQGGRGSGGDR